MLIYLLYSDNVKNIFIKKKPETIDNDQEEDYLTWRKKNL